MDLAETAKTTPHRTDNIINGSLSIVHARESILQIFLHTHPIDEPEHTVSFHSLNLPPNLSPLELPPTFPSYAPTHTPLPPILSPSTPHISLEIYQNLPQWEFSHSLSRSLPPNLSLQERTSSTPQSSPYHRRSLSLPQFPPKCCYYYNKGYCKHGSNCRFHHGPLTSLATQYSRERNGHDGATTSSGSLTKLELELVDLLRLNGGQPVSIATLRPLYFNMYGRNLQADGYLTESQRNGRPGVNLTRLLGRLKNTIRIIERPHGQHEVMLVEEFNKYVENRNEINNSISASQQIYLTFPHNSSFTEADVANYFGKFGRVLDVRIPMQQKRMFGFVTFESAETVNTLLSKKKSHSFCGSRILVKPYKEKSRSRDRRFERSELSSDSHLHHFDSDSNLYNHSYEYSYIRELDRKFESMSMSSSFQNLPEEPRRMSRFGCNMTQPHFQGNDNVCPYNDEDIFDDKNEDQKSLELLLPADLFSSSSEDSNSKR